MHLIDKDPIPASHRKATSTPMQPMKPSLGQALKNKIKGVAKTARSVAGSPGRGIAKFVQRATHDPKMRQADKDFNFLKDYNARAKSGVENSDKDRAIFQSFKDRK